jgi:hypothetical protein
MVNFERQSQLARLLAKENISVRHGNYRTAFFNVESRELGLPLWKDQGKDVYDLLVGHEVGHALYTPAEGWHESDKEIPGLPRSYVNVVEDIRIEKMIQRTYPGLVASFKRGYNTLNENDFFGLSKFDINDLGLIDRINVKAKLRDLVDVQFSKEEMPLVKQAMAVETWEDVLNACKALFEFAKENKDEQEQTSEVAEQLSSESNNFPQPDSGEPTSSDEQVDNEVGDESNQQEDRSGGEEDSTESPLVDSPSNDASGEDSETDSKEESKSEIVESSTEPTDVDPTRSLTDEVFRSREEDLLDVDSTGTQPLACSAMTREQANEVINTYKQVFDARDKYFEETQETFAHLRASKDPDGDYIEFVNESKKYVNVMAKEFEMRKMAFRYSRAQTARTGSLDVNNLYSYKYNDDIFKKVTQLADAKSHGMVMLIDYSGSMHGVLDDVIKQTLLLAAFCKKVNIPFEVYSFTSGHNDDVTEYSDLRPGQIAHQRVIINQLLSSSMNKRDFARGYKDLFVQTVGRWSDEAYFGWGKLERMGGTPLIETLQAMRFVLADFQQKTGVQKVNFIALTDGDGQRAQFVNDYANSDFRTRGVAMNMDGKSIV